jgi:hypothetical protein
MTIEVKDGANGFKILATIERVPDNRLSYTRVRFQGKQYQLFGGIHNPFFIDIANPLRVRKTSVTGHRYMVSEQVSA